MNCFCQNVEFGTYEVAVPMKCPFIEANGGLVSIDGCIATEIAFLWNNGVHTINSCCGHNKQEPTVIVKKNSVTKMHELGFKLADIKCANPEQTFSLLECDAWFWSGGLKVVKKDINTSLTELANAVAWFAFVAGFSETEIKTNMVNVIEEQYLQSLLSTTR